MNIVVTPNFIPVKPVKPVKPELESVTITVPPALAKMINVLLWSFNGSDAPGVDDQYDAVNSLADALDDVVGKGNSYGYEVDGSIELIKN